MNITSQAISEAYDKMIGFGLKPSKIMYSADNEYAVMNALGARFNPTGLVPCTSPTANIVITTYGLELRRLPFGFTNECFLVAADGDKDVRFDVATPDQFIVEAEREVEELLK